MISPRLLYWSQSEPRVNFGDYVTQYFLDALGMPWRSFRQFPNDDGSPVFFGVGTMFADYWLKDLARGQHVIVWGSGWGGAPCSTPIRADVRAARGPLTRKALGLPADLPLGDPALFLPRFLPFDANGSGPTVFVPHWEQLAKRGLSEVAAHAARIGAERVLSPLVPPAEFPDLIGAIARARYVFTGSLHGAIVAHAYGVPWAPSLMPGEQFNLARKWEDWALFLGLDPLALAPRCNEAQRAKCDCGDPSKWFEKHVAGLPRPDLAPLARAFPFPGFHV